MEEKNGKQNILIETKAHHLVNLQNCLGTMVYNYDLTAHNERAIKDNAERNNAIYAKDKPVRKNVRTNGTGSGPIIIGNAEINNYFMEKIA